MERCCEARPGHCVKYQKVWWSDVIFPLSDSVIVSVYPDKKKGKFCITKSKTTETVSGALSPRFFFYRLLVVLAIWLFVLQICVELFREGSAHGRGV